MKKSLNKNPTTENEFLLKFWKICAIARLQAALSESEMHIISYTSLNNEISKVETDLVNILSMAVYSRTVSHVSDSEYFSKVQLTHWVYEFFIRVSNPKCDYFPPDEMRNENKLGGIIL